MLLLRCTYIRLNINQAHNPESHLFLSLGVTCITNLPLFPLAWFQHTFCSQLATTMLPYHLSIFLSQVTQILAEYFHRVLAILWIKWFVERESSNYRVLHSVTVSLPVRFLQYFISLSKNYSFISESWLMTRCYRSRWEPRMFHTRPKHLDGGKRPTIRWRWLFQINRDKGFFDYSEGREQIVRKIYNWKL